MSVSDPRNPSRHTLALKAVILKLSPRSVSAATRRCCTVESGIHEPCYEASHSNKTIEIHLLYCTRHLIKPVLTPSISYDFYQPFGLSRLSRSPEPFFQGCVQIRLPKFILLYPCLALPMSQAWSSTSLGRHMDKLRRREAAVRR